MEKTEQLAQQVQLVLKVIEESRALLVRKVFQVLLLQWVLLAQLVLRDRRVI
jgi:hypothetical protein